MTLVLRVDRHCITAIKPLSGSAEDILKMNKLISFGGLSAVEQALHIKST